MVGLQIGMGWTSVGKLEQQWHRMEWLVAVVVVVAVGSCTCNLCIEWQRQLEQRFGNLGIVGIVGSHCNRWQLELELVE
ncbi:hypothetical protein WICPIJ_009798 [Wickerhamomyces pijperi]|uniref:Uncharacterized protein n=1 Tax=Wickerhamomyces pijperi TaxID=599730 RepID=A0A9P8PKW1_WICPI|nr:hypothetical protein WICPIJ_009798 [Wickerhamomyces pijperi]